MRHHRVPQGGSPDGRAAAEELRIEGIHPGATLARAPNSVRGVRVSLRAIGSDAPVQWLLDGRWIAQTLGAQPFQREFDAPGTHALTALSDTGAWARVEFRVLR